MVSAIQEESEAVKSILVLLNHQDWNRMFSAHSQPKYRKNGMRTGAKFNDDYCNRNIRDSCSRILSNKHLKCLLSLLLPHSLFLFISLFHSSHLCSKASLLHTPHFSLFIAILSTKFSSSGANSLLFIHFLPRLPFPPIRFQVGIHENSIRKLSETEWER